MRKLLLFLSLLAGACGEGVKKDELLRSVDNQQAATNQIDVGAVPVRIGEFGPNFGACGLAGTTRRADPASDSIEVRAAPYDSAAQIGTIPAGARFFICSRSLDQRWLGIVYEEAGSLSPACGVSQPVASRRVYQGPCRSGWVAAAFVKQIAG